MEVRHRLRVVTLVSIVALGLLATACTMGGQVSETFSEIGSGLGSGDDSSGSAEFAAEEPDDGGEAALIDESVGSDGAESASGKLIPVTYQLSSNGRDIIFNAEMTIAVNDVEIAEQQAMGIVSRLGGFLFGQHTVGSPDSVSVLTFKVSPESFQQALAELGEIGETRTKNVTASDVTDRIVDLESQIDTAEASVARLRALLADAADIKQIVSLEGELLERETTLESLRGQLRTLEDQVALATIAVSITEATANPEFEVLITGYSGHDSGELCPGSGDLSFEMGSKATLCYTFTNVGDTNLTDFELRDPVLDIELDDLVPVVGDPGDVIEPGESLLFAAEVTVDRSLRLQTSVSAQPVADGGEPISGEPATYTATVHVVSVDPGGVPTFSEGLEKSWQVLISLGEVILLGLGAVVPFLWVPLLAWLFFYLWNRRQERTTGGGA